MLIDLIRNGFSAELILTLGVRLMIILLFLPVHELAHGYAAYKLGDYTARNQGRLTFNPIAHLDVMGFILSVFTGFGFAKPVPVNMLNFRPEHRKRNMAIVAFAGPLSNILLAILFIVIFYLLVATGIADGNGFIANLGSICILAARCNLSLAVFNLFPVPPLDGSRVLNAFLPDKYYYKIMQYERQIGMVFFILVLTGALSGIISLFSNLLFNGLNTIISLPFGMLN